MKVRKVRKLFGYIFSIFIVIFVLLNINKIDETLGIYPQEANSNILTVSKKPEFIYLGGNSFKTVGSKPIFAHDCLGCGELGDIDVFHNSESVKLADYTFKANCNGKFDVVQRGFQFNEKGEKIGERCVVIFPDNQARIVWTESEKDLWIMSAPTLELVQEFEKSPTYKLYKSARK